MLRSRILLVGLICLLAVAAVPAAGLAQTSGAAQYGGVDPDTGSGQDPAGGTGAGGGGQGSSKTLPLTGQDLLLVLIAGGGLVGLGFVLRTAARREPGTS